MIIKPGSVEVTEGAVRVIDFHFQGVTKIEGGIEACEWAIECLKKHIAIADAAARPRRKEPTMCGYCSYEESDGELIEQCAKCKKADNKE